MTIVMEMNTGKILDEACNHNNDAYGDEVLYAACSALSEAHPNDRSATREPRAGHGRYRRSQTAASWMRKSRSER